jgi:hypothetical protein
MNCFADSSFLLSVAGTDVNTRKASAWLATYNRAVVISALVQFECVNRIRKLRHAGTLSE